MKLGRANQGIVLFNSEEQRDTAIKALDGLFVKCGAGFAAISAFD